MNLSPLQLNPALLSAAKTPEASVGAQKGLDMKRIEETAKDFEAMFLSEMMKPMFDSVDVDETFGGGKGEEMFRGFLRDEYAKDMSATAGIGIAELVKEQLIEMQSKALNPAQSQELAQNMHGKSSGTTGESDV